MFPHEAKLSADKFVPSVILNETVTYSFTMYPGRAGKRVVMPCLYRPEYRFPLPFLEVFYLNFFSYFPLFSFYMSLFLSIFFITCFSVFTILELFQFYFLYLSRYIYFFFIFVALFNLAFTSTCPVFYFQWTVFLLYFCSFLP